MQASAQAKRSGIAPWLALVGLLGIAAGILTFAWPGITAFVLLLFIAENIDKWTKVIKFAGIKPE